MKRALSISIMLLISWSSPAAAQETREFSLSFATNIGTLFSGILFTAVSSAQDPNSFQVLTSSVRGGFDGGIARIADTTFTFQASAPNFTLFQLNTGFFFTTNNGNAWLFEASIASRQDAFNGLQLAQPGTATDASGVLYSGGQIQAVPISTGPSLIFLGVALFGFAFRCMLRRSLSKES